MIRVGFTMIGGRDWAGGYHYLLNLLKVLTIHAPGRVEPVVFFADDLDREETQPFRSLPGVEVVLTAGFRGRRRSRGSLQALLIGRDAVADREFIRHRIDVVFEAAQFFGRRLSCPAIAWIPDFQHRFLRHLFPFAAYWKREIGFRAQIRGGRAIMLSSDDSRKICERLYPATRGRISVVRFAAVAPTSLSPEDARRTADEYQLPPYFFFMPNQFWQHKNHSLVIGALDLLRQQGRDDIVVAASGNNKDPRNPAHYSELMSRVERSGLRNQFRVLGMVPRHHLSHLMAASAALINPSLFEGWSTTVEEAKSAGVPMILSDLDVHREQVGDGAIYFARDSPQSLADVLLRFVPLDAVARAERVAAAAVASETNLAEFANQFALLVENTVKKLGP